MNNHRKDEIRPSSAGRQKPVPAVPSNSRSNILSASAGSNRVAIGGSYPVTKPASNIFIDTGTIIVIIKRILNKFSQ